MTDQERDEALRLWKEARESGPRVPQFDDDVQSTLKLSVNQMITLIRLARAQTHGEPFAFRLLLEEAAEGFSRVMVATSDNERVYGWLGRVKKVLERYPINASPPAQAIQEGRQPVPVKEIVHALEREAANTDTDSRWLAASQLRNMSGWESRTLMCRIDQRASSTLAAAPKPGVKDE